MAGPNLVRILTNSLTLEKRQTTQNTHKGPSNEQKTTDLSKINTHSNAINNFTKKSKI